MVRSSRKLPLSNGNVGTAVTFTKEKKHLKNARSAITQEATSKCGVRTTENIDGKVKEVGKRDGERSNICL